MNTTNEVKIGTKLGYRGDMANDADHNIVVTGTEDGWLRVKFSNGAVRMIPAALVRTSRWYVKG